MSNSQILITLVVYKETVMKKSSLFLVLGLLSTQAFANNNLPFVGTKRFDFGGVPVYHEGYTLSIKKNGQTKLTKTICYSSHCDRPVTLYSGAFKSMIGFKEDGQQYYIQLTKKQAKLLNRNKQQEYDCDTVNGNYGPCVSRYY